MDPILKIILPKVEKKRFHFTKIIFKLKNLEHLKVVLEISINFLVMGKEFFCPVCKSRSFYIFMRVVVVVTESSGCLVSTCVETQTTLGNLQSLSETNESSSRLEPGSVPGQKAPYQF